MRSEDKRFQKSFALLSNWHIWRDELTKTSILAAQTTVSVEKGALMRLPGVFPVALQRPLDMFANKAGWIVQPRSERFNHCRRRWSIAQGNGQISEPALMAGAAYGAAFGAFQKGFFVPAKQLDKLTGGSAIARSKNICCCELREANRWTPHLAVNAANPPAATLAAQTH